MKWLSWSVVTVVLLAGSAPAEAQWVPPVGIPNPTFGIKNVAPASPQPWTTAVPGFYYIDENVAAATDTSNPYGTPGRPRRTIPIALPAGSVVEVHGAYAYYHGSPRTIVSAGTEAAPVYIRGSSSAPFARATSCWELTGSYYIVERIEFASCGNVLFLAPTHHAALRHSDVHGTPSGGGVGVLSWTGQTVSDVVIWNNQVHDNGDAAASYDQDVHGIAISANAHHVWLVDNHIYRNSGDGVQINAGSLAQQGTTHHIFVGRNYSHDNRQSGFWTKQATDVIFSQNTAYSHRPSSSSLGACMGGQYAPELVWFIDNVMWGCDFGIQLASDASLGVGRHAFFIGNVITMIHDSNNDFQPGSAWQNCAISLPGGINRYVIENSIFDVDSGVCVPFATGALYLYDNVMERIRSNGHDLIVDSPVMAANLHAASNLFAPTFRLGVSGVVTTVGPSPPGPFGSNRAVASIQFLNPVGGDFRLAATSPAVGTGVMNRLGIWEFFQARYGVSLAVDKDGVRRDLSAPPDSGATER